MNKNDEIAKLKIQGAKAWINANVQQRHIELLQDIKNDLTQQLQQTTNKNIYKTINKLIKELEAKIEQISQN